MNPAWMFTLASIIAVFGILFAFKKLVSSIQYKLEHQQLTQESLQKEQSRYFIHVAIAEAIPILLIILGFMQLDKTEISTFSTTVSTLIVIGLIVLAVVNILLARSELLSSQHNIDEFKSYITSLLFLGFGTMLAIPVISLVALFM